MGILYFIIALLATTIGAMAGLGGGVIIKPVLDVLGNYNLSTISVLSSITVFSMAIISIGKQMRYKVRLEIRKTTFIGLGSIIGGLIGEWGINFTLRFINASIVTIIQNLTLALSLVLVYVYMNNREKFKSYNVKNDIVCIIIGIFLGGISSYLSIGGGPINVCILTIFFSMEAKEAAVNSIITILFSQASKLVSVAFTTGFGVFDLSMLPFMVIGGILGGFLGSGFNKKYTNEIILKVFNAVVICLFLLNIYNALPIFALIK